MAKVNSRLDIIYLLLYACYFMIKVKLKTWICQFWYCYCDKVYGSDWLQQHKVQYLSGCYPEATTDVEMLEDHVFKVFDTNGDGYINFAEFLVSTYIYIILDIRINILSIDKYFTLRLVKVVFHILQSQSPDDVVLKLFVTFGVDG